MHYLLGTCLAAVLLSERDSDGGDFNVNKSSAKCLAVL